MGADRGCQKGGKKYLSKNKSIKLYKEKAKKIQLFKAEVELLKSSYAKIDSESIQKFDDFPLSERTRKALKKAKYINPTEIQKDSIGLALKGHDILGAAKTGSGKTLAFVIPILECLYCSGWTILDGLGVIVITPTRELAYQIFEVLNNVGSYHHFSVALVIGGKDLAKERKALDKCNIMICTPGRLLQHMDENALFDATNLKMLILDEADRILDLGFEKTVNAILENLPTDRQTLLFSATQTRSVKDLARLSLKNPVYVSVHEHAKYSTPENLRQNYLECEAHLKMNLLWSFIKSHKQQKILVFMASCKQVKFFQESIIRLKPHVEIMALHGRLHQLRRMQIYDEFCRKNHVVMLATDVAARGLDFPNINWVVQLDCPEDTNTYIHRAGRTARYKKNGESLLVLLPSEKPSMVEQLKNKKIPIEELKVNPQKLYDVQRKLEAICARDVNLKNSAKRACQSYIKTILLMKDKTVFDVTKIDEKLYAKSLGLARVPRLRFLDKIRKMKMQTSQNFQISDDSASDNDFQISDASDSHDDFQISGGSDSDDDLLTPKGAPELPDTIESDIEELNESKKPITKAALAKRVLKKKIKSNTVIKFDDDGNAVREVCGKVVPVVASELQNQMLEEGYSIEKAKLMKEKEEEIDKILFKEKVKQKHREERLKMKEKRKKDQGVSPELGNAKENEEEGDSADDLDPNSISLSKNSYDDNKSADDNDDSISESDDDDDDNINESDDDKSGSEEPVHYVHKEKLQDSRKRKKDFVSEVKKRQKKDKSFCSSELSLDDEEQLALHFLSNS